MKSIFLPTIATVLLFGCGEMGHDNEHQPNVVQEQAILVEPKAIEKPEAKTAEPNRESTKPAERPATEVQPPIISIRQAAASGNIESIKEHLVTGTDVNTRGNWQETPLHEAALWGHKEITAILIINGAAVNAQNIIGKTPLDGAVERRHIEIATLLRKHGGKTNVELKTSQD